VRITCLAWKKTGWAALWLLLLGLAYAWRAQNLNAFGLSNDEGIHLMWGRLTAAGYALYRETYAVQSPLFLESLALAFKLAGATVTAGRWAILPWFGGLAVALSWLAYPAGRWPAAISALVLLAIAPLAFWLSRLAMAEVPATALAAVSLALLARPAPRPHRGWLLASGLALGLSLIFKALNPLVVLPAAALLGWRRFFPRPDWRGLAVDGLLWGAAAALPVAAVFLVYDPAAAYDQLIAFRSDLRAAVPGSWAETGAQFQLFAAGHWSLLLLAAAGVAVARRQVIRPVAGTPPYPLLWLLWLLGGVAMLTWHTPLFAQHFIIVLPPLVLLGAGFIGETVAAWPSGSAGGRAARLLVIAGALAGVPAMAQANQAAALVVTGGREQAALQLLQTVTNPTDFVMGDSQFLIFMANRASPPPLGDLALVGIKAGRQNSARLIRINTDYQAPAVVQWSLRLPWLPEYLDWVNQNYLARQVWDNDHIIHFVRRLPAAEPLPHPQNARLGEWLALRGYQIDTEPVAPGQSLNLKVYWQTDAPLQEDYTVFTQLLDSHGALAASFDSQPLGGYFSTSRWPAGEIITDMVHLPLPKDLPPGRYTLVTGMYRLDTLARLPVPNRPDNSVALGQLEVR